MNYKTAFLLVSIFFLYQLCIQKQVLAQQEESVPVNSQVWIAYAPNWNFATNWSAYFEVEYEQLLNTDNNWYFAMVYPGVEYYPSRSFALILNGLFGYTQQAQGEATFESRPIVGARWSIVKPERRIPLSFQLTYEYRFINYLSSRPHNQSSRLRSRFYGYISLNRKNILEDKNVYLRLMGEYFMNLDDEAEERFWNIGSGVLGINYRHNYKWRYELRYYLTQTRNTREDTRPSSINHVFYIRIINFF